MSQDPNLPRETLDLLIDMAVQLGYDRRLIQFPERRKVFCASAKPDIPGALVCVIFVLCFVSVF